MSAPAKPRNAPRHGAAPSWTKRRVALAALAVFVFASALYLPTLRNDFARDDLAFIENPDIKTLDAPMVKHLFASNYWKFEEVNSGHYRPLSALSMHTDYQLYGDAPAGFHFTNVLLNATVCTLLFLVMHSLFSRPDIALMAALFFAAFPTHVENVAWVSGRTDLLASLFMLAALWCYITWRKCGAWFRLIGVFFGFAAALLAKETAVIFPGVIALVELAVLAPPRGNRSHVPEIIMVSVLFSMAGFYFALRAHVLGAAITYFPRFSHGAVQAVALSFSILAHYAYKLLYPLRVSAETDFLPPASFWNVHTLVGIAILAAGAFALCRWRKDGALVFGLGVLAIGLAPVLSILPVNQVTAERFLYFPSVGFALLVSLAVRAGMARWRPLVFVFGAVVALYSARTVLRIFDWKDDLTLYQQRDFDGAIAAHPCMMATSGLEGISCKQ